MCRNCIEFTILKQCSLTGLISFDRVIELNLSEEIGLEFQAISLIIGESFEIKVIEIVYNIKFLDCGNIFDEPLSIFDCCKLVIFTHIEDNGHILNLFNRYLWNTMRVISIVISILPPPISLVIIILLELCSIHELSKVNDLLRGGSVHFLLVFHWDDG